MTASLRALAENFQRALARITYAAPLRNPARKKGPDPATLPLPGQRALFAPAFGEAPAPRRPPPPRAPEPSVPRQRSLFGAEVLAPRPAPAPPAPAADPRQVDLLETLAARVAEKIERVELPPPPPPPLQEGSPGPRFVLVESVRGWDVSDRMTNTEDRRSLRAPLFPSSAAAQRRAAELEAPWQDAVAARFADLAPDARVNAIENGLRARVLDPAVFRPLLEALRAPAPPVALPADEVFAEGAEARPRRTGRLAPPAPPRARAAACEVLPAAAAEAEGTGPALERVFYVLEGHMPVLRKKIETWNRKAEKLRGFPVRIEVGPREVRTVTQYEEVETGRGTALVSREVKRWAFPVRIVGEIPRLNGWVFVAKLVPTGAENVVQAVGDIPVPLRFRARVNTCEHCRTSRKRSETFVLYHEANRRYIQVGRSCLADFLPGLSAEQVVSLLEELPTLRAEASKGELGGEGRGPELLDLADFLAHVAQEVRANGWLGASAARDRGSSSTAQAAHERIRLRASKDEAKRRKYVAPSEQDEADARASIAHWLAQPGSSDFERDLLAIARAGVVDARTEAKAAFMVPGYQRAAGAARGAAPAPRKHLGAVGQTLEPVVVELERVIDPRSEQYDTRLYKMRTLDGDTLSWFSAPGKMREGRRYLVTGTVSKHGVYNGQPETQLTRAAALNDLTPPERLTGDDAIAQTLVLESLAGRFGPLRLRRMGDGSVAIVGDGFAEAPAAPALTPRDVLGYLGAVDPVLHARIAELLEQQSPGRHEKLARAGEFRPQVPFAVYARAVLLRHFARPAAEGAWSSFHKGSKAGMVFGASARAKGKLDASDPEAFVAAAEAASPELRAWVERARRAYAAQS